MQDREDTRLQHSENSHRLSRAIDSHPPLLAKEQQYRRDERPRVPDTYPPHKVGDVPRPTYAFVEPPRAYAVAQGYPYCPYPPEGCKEGNTKGNPPRTRSTTFDGARYIFTDSMIGFIVEYLHK